MTNPFKVIAPRASTLDQLSVSMSTLIKTIAWELGERYDNALQPVLGHDWLAQLAVSRGERPYSVSDPAFAFSEPEHDSGSPVWRALPPWTPALRTQFYRARTTRNYWEHQLAKQNIHTYLQGVRYYQELSSSLSLSTLEACEALLMRGPQLRQGYVPPNKLAVVDELKAAAEAAVREANSARELLDRAVVQADGNEEARARAEAAASAAEAQMETLKSQLEAAQQEARVDVDEPANHLTVGDPWDLPIVGTRQLTLNRNMVDLLDPERAEMLSTELGTVATDAARRWLVVMPRGGQVYLTPAGHAAGKVGGRWVYLGRLDAITVEFCAGAVPSEIPGGEGFEVTLDSDVRELEGDRRLSSVIGAEAASSVAALLRERIHTEEIFRVTPSLVAIVQREGQWTQAAQLQPNQWFG